MFTIPRVAATDKSPALANEKGKRRPLSNQALITFTATNAFSARIYICSTSLCLFFGATRYAADSVGRPLYLFFWLKSRLITHNLWDLVCVDSPLWHRYFRRQDELSNVWDRRIILPLSGFYGHWIRITSVHKKSSPGFEALRMSSPPEIMCVKLRPMKLEKHGV